VEAFRAAGAANAVFIWCYEPDGPADFAATEGGKYLWYPGDEYVDWFGLDVFSAAHFDPGAPFGTGEGVSPREEGPRPSWNWPGRRGSRCTSRRWQR
jgi:hypothetical protein